MRAKLVASRTAHLPLRARSRRRCTGRARAVGAVRASASAACASCIPCLHEHAAPCVDAGARRLNEDKWFYVASRELRVAERATLVPWRGLPAQPAGSCESGRGASRCVRFCAYRGAAVHCGRRRSPGERMPAAAMAASAGPRRLELAIRPSRGLGVRGACIGVPGERCEAAAHAHTAIYDERSCFM